ncbi:MAG: hypothetical protein ACOYB1_15290 [Limnohabitans sp.]
MTPTRILPRRLWLALSLLTPAAMALPVNTQWSFEVSVQKNAPTPDAVSKAIVSAASLLGSVTLGNGQDTGEVDKLGYSFSTRISATPLLSQVFDKLSILRRSNGRFINGMAQTTRYSEKRGRGDELLMVTNTAAKRYEFYKGGKLTETQPLLTPVCDLTSAPYAFLGKPVPMKSTALAFSDGRSIRKVSLISSAEKVKVDGKPINAIRLSGNTSAGPLDLWLRVEDGYPLRMRVNLGSKYGATLDQIAQSIPAKPVLF